MNRTEADMTFASRIVTIIIAAIVILATWNRPAFGDDEKKRNYSPREFLEVARHPPGRECWASMSGEITHRRKGKSTVSAPLYVGIRFTPEMTLAQVLIDGDESYMIGQRYKAGEDAISVIPEIAAGKKQHLAVFGLRPEDLAMSFLFWTFVEERPRSSVRGRECRVFVLESPGNEKRRVKVNISAEYFFPLKVEWLPDEPTDGEPIRTLEIDSFQKEGDFWLVSELRAYGPDWRTAIDFDECDAAYTNEKRPNNLFREVVAKTKNDADVK